MKTVEKQEKLVDGKGRQIPITSWIPSKSVSQLIIIHGFCEHTGCYRHVAENLANRGVAVHTMDLPGHGNADGIRGHIDHFEEYLDNVSLLVNENPFLLKTKSVFLLGHSLGGLISLLFCIRRNNRFKGLVLTSPLTGFPPMGSLITGALARFLTRNHRDEPFPKPNGPGSLSRIPGQWKIYNSDPLRGRLITPNLYLQMEAMIKQLTSSAASLSIPYLMFISSKDSVVSPQAAQRLFSQSGSTDKSLIVFTEAMHELLQEPECDQILDKLHDWMAERS